MASPLSNTTAPSAGAAAFIPPAGTNWLAIIEPSLNFFAIGTIMGSILLTMLFVLLFFSTPQIRRKPIFISNVLAIVFGIGGSIITAYTDFRSILIPGYHSPQTNILFGFWDALVPIFVDAILILRLHAVFPSSQTPRVKFIAIMAFPVLLKIGRIINAVIYQTNYADHQTVAQSQPTEAGSVLITSKLPNVKIEWFLQIFDNAYCSLIFLLRLRVGRSSRSPQLATHTSSTFSRKLKTLFWIAVTNFVFPVMLSIVQLVVYMASSNYLLALYVEMVNFHITIIGVVFATLWSTTDQHVHSEPAVTTMSTFVVARMSVPDASNLTVLELSQPDEGQVGNDEEKAADAPSVPYGLDLNMGRSEGPSPMAL